MSVAQIESRISKQVSAYENSPAQVPEALLMPVRPESRRISLRELLTYGSLIIGLAGSVIGYEKLTEPSHLRVTEIVHPYDTDWSLATRAENKVGANLDAIDVRPIVDQIRSRYGLNPKPGTKVTVEAAK